MPVSHSEEIAHSPNTARASRWLDILWVGVMLVLLALSVYSFKAVNLCAYMGTDYRGYYTSALIARQHGFAAVYDHDLQREYQGGLAHPCAPQTLPPMQRVSMPYLPLFVLLFLPLSFLGFTPGYLVWVGLNLGVLVFYLLRYSKALGLSPTAFRLLQWVVCLPVIANLYLGQVNVFLLVCLGEFSLGLIQQRPRRSGLWLSGLLVKPHTLILLLPGLLLSRRWAALRGFLAGALLVVGSSIALAGLDGVRASLELAAEFAGPLIRTAASMMNWRAMALNLSAYLPAWSAWSVAGAGMALVIGLVLYLWLRHGYYSKTGSVLIILATWAGTLTLAWHSHFYLLVPLVPLLLYLDEVGVLPLSMRAAWLLGPALWYILVYALDPSSARNGFGVGMLALSLILLVWAAGRLTNNTAVQSTAHQSTADQSTSDQFTVDQQTAAVEGEFMDGQRI
ncbi:MAG: glycosyltransferase family 87 protein [Anaerolineales bacterium]